jgi:hypothetical protein
VKLKLRFEKKEFSLFAKDLAAPFSSSDHRLACVHLEELTKLAGIQSLIGALRGLGREVPISVVSFSEMVPRFIASLNARQERHRAPSS